MVVVSTGPLRGSNFELGLGGGLGVSDTRPVDCPNQWLKYVQLEPWASFAFVQGGKGVFEWLHTTAARAVARALLGRCGATNHPREQKPMYLIATSRPLIAYFMGR